MQFFFFSLERIMLSRYRDGFLIEFTHPKALAHEVRMPGRRVIRRPSSVIHPIMQKLNGSGDFHTVLPCSSTFSATSLPYNVQTLTPISSKFAVLKLAITSIKQPPLTNLR